MTDRDQRRHVRQRVPVVHRAKFEYTYETPRSDLVADLSEGGAFVVTRDPVPVGTELQYKLHLPNQAQSIEGQARVVRQEPGLGMAVGFVDLSQEDDERIKHFVASVLFKVPLG